MIGDRDRGTKMAKPSNLPKLSKGQRDALRKIAAGEGSFHAITGARIERALLAYPVSGFSNFIVGCNHRTADGWVLTELGQACI